MKNEPRTTGPAENEADEPAPEETQDADLKGRNGEGARSAMKHWLHEERHRVKRPEH